MGRGLITIEIAFNVKENETSLPIANDEIRGLISGQLFDDELARRRVEWLGKSPGVAPNQSHCALFRTPEGSVEHQDGKERIRADIELDRLALPRLNRPVVPEATQIQIHHDASIRDNQ